MLSDLEQTCVMIDGIIYPKVRKWDRWIHQQQWLCRLGAHYFLPAGRHPGILSCYACVDAADTAPGGMETSGSFRSSSDIGSKRATRSLHGTARNGSIAEEDGSLCFRGCNSRFLTIILAGTVHRCHR